MVEGDSGSRLPTILGDGNRDTAVADAAAAVVGALMRLSEDEGKVIKCRSQLSIDMGSILIDLPGLTAPDYIGRAKQWFPDEFDCLDFGCGNAPHRKALEAAGAKWLGCDYMSSTDPATLARAGSDLGGSVISYDGRVIPLDDSRFDVVWSWQALEHVQEPEVTFAEIARVLKVGGYFVGSTSFLEPYHAQSTYSYTPYGFKLICERHGLKLIECAPAIDGLSYILKRLAIFLDVIGDAPKSHQELRRRDPLRVIREALVRDGRGNEWVHLLAQICGTFRFAAIKSGPTANS